MELSGEYTINAPRETVWKALNDPDILKQSIPGCQEIEKSADNEFTAKVKAKVGPVNATFSGKVTLSNLNPPESYTISGEGTGGAAGFAKGGADVKLEDQGQQTVLKYDVNAQVGGKLAQLGQRLIQSTANKYARQFFEKFTEIVGGGAPAEAEAEAAAPQPEPAGGEAAPAKAAAETEAAPRGGAEKPAEPAPSAPKPSSEEKAGGVSSTVWIGGAIAVVIILIVIFAL